MDNKDICVCGHPRGIHGIGSSLSSNEICWAFGIIGPACRNKCTKFKLNNLKYLESLYESRTGRA